MLFINLSTHGILDIRMRFPTLPAGTGYLKVSGDVPISVPFVQMWCGCELLHSWNPAQAGVLHGVEPTCYSSVLHAVIG